MIDFFFLFFFFTDVSQHKSGIFNDTTADKNTIKSLLLNVDLLQMGPYNPRKYFKKYYKGTIRSLD